MLLLPLFYLQARVFQGVFFIAEPCSACIHSCQCEMFVFQGSDWVKGKPLAMSAGVRLRSHLEPIIPKSSWVLGLAVCR